MTLSQNIRRLNLTSHITFSVGWLGSVVAFFALALVSITSQRIENVRAVCIAMEIVSWYVILPFCIGSFITGLVQSLGTNWGIFKYYWVTVKFILTLGASFLLILHLKPITYLAQQASEIGSLDKISSTAVDLSIKSAAAIFVLLSLIFVSVYKPWGRIKYASQPTKSAPLNEEIKTRSWAKKWLILTLVAALILLILKHLMGGAMHH